MMTDVMKAVEQMSLDELRQLREYVQQREQQIELHAGTVDIDSLLSGLVDIRAGLSDETFAEIERAMNDHACP